MALITFVKDVTLDNELQGTGPHYRAGYQCDVAPKVAAAWIASGDAVAGFVEVEREEPTKKDEKPAPLPRRRKKWTPLDDGAGE